MYISKFTKALTEKRAALQKRISEALAVANNSESVEPSYVFYEVYPTLRNGLPVDNLDEIALEGTVVFCGSPDPDLAKYGYSSDQKEYSETVSNPTWLDVAVLANQMVEVTKNHHKMYLRDIEVVRQVDGVKYVEFVMGYGEEDCSDKHCSKHSKKK